ncbi:hypothetical protein J4760_12600 [Salinicoccus sp. ID82-1]|uniref:hypothetical protein n=1 Tax=Salinicoccus TaxID=45669 RepID=UPI001643B2C1|nr:MULTISPECIES: hypothetical protein [Salinicoccus]MCG1010862.1 hypothetical protein [Salinicoccus sp. ID82-1]
MYRLLFIFNCFLIGIMILVSTTSHDTLLHALQIIVFVLSVYLFYSYTKQNNRRRK